uniref:DUF3581 domain-containing protein n=1 Tax=uncultured Thiotrichaceae bacterium TaxID=298394 RepID=A0A6S6UBM9_9GAMM|nr:MAG: Unknown protein [uncultured Thiotrichaceae bacterium]
MYLDQFHQADKHQVTIAAEQASRFAKEIADDYNPLHNPDAKRFCVPGDLLFSLVLSKYGLSQKMCFIFKGMVGDNTALNFTPSDDAEFALTDDKEKVYLEVERSGELSHDQQMIETLTRNYVAFSGQNFPHTLQPLLAENDVMINQDRPMVIYERMSFDLDRVDLKKPGMEAAKADFEVNGKRGTANLNFIIKDGDETVGTGFKRLIVSGLKPYDETAAQALVQAYMDSKANYQNR